MTDPYTLIAMSEQMIKNAITMLSALDRIDDGAFRRLFEVELLLSSTLADAEALYDDGCIDYDNDLADAKEVCGE